MEKLNFFQKKSSLRRKEGRESNVAQHFNLTSFNTLILFKRLEVAQSFNSLSWNEPALGDRRHETESNQTHRNGLKEGLGVSASVLSDDDGRLRDQLLAEVRRPHAVGAPFVG